MDTRHLRSFLKVVETRSITRAAISLRITQPSLSQQMLRLEDEVGLSLFRRTARGVNLTEAGRIFHERAPHILRSIELAIEDARQLTEPAGDVTLAVPHSISKLAGVTLVEAFLQHAPQVSLRLVEANTGQIRGWLDAGKIDLGVLHDVGLLRHLSVRELAAEELYLVGPAGIYGNLDALPDVPVEKLAGLPMILPGPEHGLRQVVSQTAARCGVALTVRQEIDAMAHVGSLVARGHGHSILPLPVIADDLALRRVSIARIGGGKFRRKLCLVRNGNKLVTHASVRSEELFINVLLRLIEKRAWLADPGATLQIRTKDASTRSRVQRVSAVKGRIR